MRWLGRTNPGAQEFSHRTSIDAGVEEEMQSLCSPIPASASMEHQDIVLRKVRYRAHLPRRNLVPSDGVEVVIGSNLEAVIRENPLSVEKLPSEEQEADDEQDSRGQENEEPEDEGPSRFE